MASSRYRGDDPSDGIVRQTKPDLECDEEGDHLDGQIGSERAIDNDSQVVFELGEPSDEKRQSQGQWNHLRQLVRGLLPDVRKDSSGSDDCDCAFRHAQRVGRADGDQRELEHDRPQRYQYRNEPRDL